MSSTGAGAVFTDMLLGVGVRVVPHDGGTDKPFTDVAPPTVAWTPATAPSWALCDPGRSVQQIAPVAQRRPIRDGAALALPRQVTPA